MEFQSDNGLRSSLSIGSGFGRCNGFCRVFARRFAEGIRKLTGNMLGDYWGEDQKTYRKYARGYQIGGKSKRQLVTFDGSTAQVAVKLPVP
ncbi:hypothetical protein B296_00017553 [Ensete ventricosum]|uniref:Uncharacterized protein n=1 Tax=Ensete ventricosum TaxID=4639 RepID=A0A426YK02_ENSVE|nr:hypothetical protein B296_00017553 [Ensete ventricosum]